MVTTPTVPEPAPPPVPRRRRRVRATQVSLAAAVVVVLVFVASVAFILSEAGLPFVVARVVEQTGGRLSVDEPSGSLAHSMRFRGLAWHGSETTVTATNVVVEWSPLALFSNRLAIDGLGAARITLAVKPSPGATSPPASLTLPIAVSIGNAAVTELEWQAGPRGGRITGLEFGYAGDAREHRVTALRLVSQFGTLDGGATLGATAPFPLAGSVAVVGDGPLAGARLDTTLSGTLAAIALAARGTLRDATLAVRTAVTPFAAAAFERADVALGNVDLATFGDALPRTRLALDLDLGPATGGGFGGAFRAVNAAPGTLDDQRLPLAGASGRYAYAQDTLTLSGFDAEVAGGGHVRGDGTIQLAAPGAPSRWRLAVGDLDLARLAKPLVATRLSGTLAADVERGRQTFEGDLAQDGMRVAFAAAYAERRIDVTRLRAEANGGVVTGSGRIALDAPRAFDVALNAQRFDPSRFGAWPEGALDGTVKAEGVLLPEWKTTAAVTLATGSRFRGVAVAGSVRGTATRRTLADATIDVTAGAARLGASGSAGAVGDRLAFTLDATRVEDLATLLPVRLAQPLSGRLRASGTLRAEPGGVGGDVEARGDNLAYGADGATTVTLKASIEPGGAAAASVPVEARTLSLAVAATGVRARALTLARADANVDGTLARHAASFAAKGAALDATARLEGGLGAGADFAKPATLRWDGRIVALANRGDMPFALAAPASLTLSEARTRLGDARIDIAEGRAHVEELAVDGGRITTRGAFDGVPLVSLAQLAGQAVPLVSTLKLSGNWAIAATPRLNGTFAVRRESGDVYGVLASGAPSPDLAFGIEALDLRGTLADDALDARLDFRSARVGRAQGTLALAAAAGAAPGRIGRTAPLTASVDAELRSLTPLQPWLGTTAVVNGAVRVALAARGTLDDPILSGTVAGDGLRVDAPPYGIALRDGRVRAHLADGGIAIDEISIAGGDGRFTASGTVAQRRANPDEPRTRIAWRAENFRITNRPDLRLVVDGEGTLAVVQKRLDITGNVTVDDGHIEYERTPPGQLGPDVVVVGRPRPPARDDGVGDLPLTLDVDVDLGRRLTFYGQGLEATLGGRVRVTTSPTGKLYGKGSIVATNGTYFAFGQRLTIDRGRVIFDGPLDNPALDVVALRKNLAVEAGVELTGTAKVPRVRITSNPPVPENEALAWLITGEAPSSGRTDYAALSAASAALMSGDGKPLTTQIAQSIGLDDISVRGGGVGTGTSNPTGTTNQVIVFGKRITDRLSVGYEQGLSIATNALRIEYALSNTLTLRAEAGTVSGVGIFYRRAFD